MGPQWEKRDLLGIYSRLELILVVLVKTARSIQIPNMF